MNRSQLDLLPPDQAAILIRKKRFWKRAIWISLAAAVLSAIGGYLNYDIGMSGISKSTGGTKSIVCGSKITDIYIYFFRPLTALCFLIFLVSIIRFLSLPKTAKP
jgi:uncharacterized membrane protein YhaH (DUF805 family)